MQRLTFAFLAFLIASTARADEIHYWLDAGRKQSSVVSGTIESETPNHIAIKAGFKNTLRTFAAQDVIEIVYAINSLAYKDALRLERAADKSAGPERDRLLADALAHYAKVETGQASAARHVQYKLAALSARLAETDSSLAEPASERLSRFQQDHPQAWQTRRCLEALAALQSARKQHRQAAAAFDALRQWPGLPGSAAADYQLRAAQALIQAGDHADAEKRLAALAADAPDDQAFDIRLLLAVCRTRRNFNQAVADLEQVIDLTMDARRLALAHNTLGDCYRQNQQPKEALYHYLAVDLLYPGDRAELARAAGHIARLFRLLKRPDRAREYEQKLKALQERGI